MNKTDSVTKVQSMLAEVLTPVCQEKGISLKLNPDTTDVGVVRTAMAVLFVPGFSSSAAVNSASFGRQVGVASVKAYVIVLSRSQQGPYSANEIVKTLVSELDNYTASDGIRVFVQSTGFTSFRDGIWQYRVELDVKLMFGSEGDYIHKTSTETW